MSTNLTYSSLVSDLTNYSERGRAGDATVIAQVPRLINLAERTIATDLKIEGYERTLVQAMQNGVSVYAKPDRWRETISMNVTVGTSRQPLFARSYEYLRAYWPDEAVTGTPVFYADYDIHHFLVAPTPNAALGWEIKIYQLPVLLDAQNETNWLTTEAPQLLLSRANLEFATFLRDGEKIAFWDGRYKEQLQSFDAQDMKKVIDRSAKREGV